MNRFKAEAKWYSAIEFYIKSESVCKKCLNIKLNEFNWYSLSISEVDNWEKITLYLKDLGTESDIESFMFQGASAESVVIYFDQIKLIKSNYVDNGTCSEPDDDDSDNFSCFVNIPYLLIVNCIIFLLLFI